MQKKNCFLFIYECTVTSAKLKYKKTLTFQKPIKKYVIS